MTACFLEPEFNFYQEKRLEVKFSEQQLSTDGGILLTRQAEERVKIIAGMAERIVDKRDPNKITHSMEQLVLQRVLHLANGYEDALDSNYMRQDPILKIAIKCQGFCQACTSATFSFFPLCSRNLSDFPSVKRS
ncbi:hypothetical protein TUMEXPCC7403_12745 [Tumidithrix helvetica PCC 7403]|uniref:transposase n=1 Tax=Tumidithrix helvetica TaxID=3457545 RepID=UPI003CABBACD